MYAEGYYSAYVFYDPVLRRINVYYNMYDCDKDWFEFLAMRFRQPNLSWLMIPPATWDCD